MAPHEEELLERLGEIVNKQSQNIDHISGQIGVVVGTMDRFVAALDQRPTKRQFWAVLLVLVLMMGLIGAQTYKNGNVGDDVKSCVDPTGSCAKRNAQGTATALASIKCVNIKLINDFATINNLKPVPIPEDCAQFLEKSGG